MPPALPPSLGEPGVGKSRLVAELARGSAPRARVVRGTCLSYGEGITYWPVGQIARELAGVRDEHSPEEVCRAAGNARLGNGGTVCVAAHIGQLPRRRRRVGHRRRHRARDCGLSRGRRPRATAGGDRRRHPVGGADLARPPGRYAVRAHRRARHGSRAGSPGASRVRPDWNATVRLEPFGAQDLERLLDVVLGGAPAALRARLAAASGGNPLFLEELVAMLRDDGVVGPDDGGSSSFGDSTLSPCRRASTHSSARDSTRSSPAPAQHSNGARSRARSSTAVRSSLSSTHPPAPPCRTDSGGARGKGLRSSRRGELRG